MKNLLKLTAALLLMVSVTACGNPADKAAQAACDCMAPMKDAQDKAESGDADPEKMMALAAEMGTCLKKIEEDNPKLAEEGENDFKKEVNTKMKELCPDMAK